MCTRSRASNQAYVLFFPHSSIISFVCVRDEHEPISFQCVGVMRINSALEWGVGGEGGAGWGVHMFLETRAGLPFPLGACS